MDHMKDWLGPTIEQQLELVLRWKEQDPAGFPRSEHVAYEDDGSNLRMRLKKVGRLQILKFESFQDPIKAVLSDSYTSILATFASSAVKAYVKKHRTRITKETQGGIIGITHYEIVATHLGPKQSSVTLLVEDLQFCGSAGSGTFGQPAPIQQRQRVGPLVRQLRELKSVEVLDVPKESDNDDVASPSSKRSPTDIGIVGNESHGDDRHSTLATQVVFQSQMPPIKELEVTVANVVQPNRTLFDRSKEARTAPKRHELPANGSRRQVNTNGDLLGLLVEVRKQRTLEGLANRNTKDFTKDGLATDKPLSESSEKHGRAAEYSHSGQHSIPRQSVPQATSSEKMRVSVHGGSTESLQQEVRGVNRDGNLGESSFRTRRDSDDNVEQRNPLKIPDQKVRAIEKHVVHTQSSKDFSIGLQNENIIGKELTNDPWNGMNRIRRRDGRISKEQQKLLDNDDSWFPPKLCRRGPVANVPIAILQGLNAAAERCDGSTESPEEQQEVLELDVTESQQASPNTGSEAAQDSDEERLSGWSSSSPPSALDDQLPPDSSFEAIVTPDRIPRKILVPDPIAVEDEGKEMNSLIAGLNQVQSGCAGPGDVSPVSQEESCDVSKANNGLPNQTLTAQAQPFVDRDNAVSLQSFESAARTQNDSSEDPARNGLDHTMELDDAVEGQTNERILSENSPKIYPQGKSTSESAGATVNHSTDPRLQSQVRRGHSRDRSSDDEDLESKLPQALGDESAVSDAEQVYGLVSPPLLPPSTAFHEGEPTLQVKRTPYHPRKSPGISPCSNTSPALLATEQDRSTPDSISEGVGADYATLAEVVVPGTHDLHSDTNIADNSPLRLGVDGTGNLLMYDGMAVENQQIRLETDTRSHKGSHKSPFKRSSSGRGVPDVESKHPLGFTPSLPVVNGSKHEKRKLTDMDQLSPFVTKRRKRLKPPAPLNFSQENRQTQDPSLIARQHRREFLASRRSHHSTNAADDSIDVTSQKTDQDTVAAGDAAQRTTSLPEESAFMELDQLPQDTSAHVTAFESVEAGGNSVLSEYKPRFGDSTPQNQSVELGDVSVERFNNASGPTAVQRSSLTMASPSSPALPTKGSVYNTFKSTYPDYSGGFEHFSGMCQRVKGLLQAERMEHRSLWDDFIIRHRTDYRDYLLDCTDRGDDPIPYERFYKHHIDEPIHSKHVLTPATLNDVIISTERTAAGLQPVRSLRSPAQALDRGLSIAKASPHEPCSLTKAREVIDLTLAGPAPRSFPATDHPSKLGRALSWIGPAKSEVNSPAFGNNLQTPKSALTRKDSTPLRTPSRVFEEPIRTPKQQTPVQFRKDPVPPQSAGQPMATADNVPDRRKSPSPYETSESNRSTIVEWLGDSSSETASPSIPESPVLDRKVTEDEQWWRDRNTPFKAFTRAYASLKSVEASMGTVDQEGILRPSSRQFDVLGWKL